MIGTGHIPDALRDCSLLVVDDDAFQRGLIGALLRSAGFHRIAYAEDGRKALEMTEAHAPDLVLLDLLMPEFDGFDTCRALRGDPRWAELPVLAMTALEERDERARIFAAGATDLILKPIHKAELMARIATHLNTRLLVRGLREANERTGAELAAARRMQASLLPGAALLEQIEHRYGVSVAARYAPCTELAGDLWGAWLIDESRFGLFALDVIGHGTIAAINAFRIHTLLQQQTERSRPGCLLENLNRALCPLFPTGQFSTFFYAVFDTTANQLAYAAAGYPNPLLGDDSAERVLDGKGLPLGIRPSARYETRIAAWAPGTSLLIYSDAVSETRDASGVMLGQDGVRRLWAQARATRGADHARATRGADDVVAELEMAVMGSAGLDDDLTLICVTR